jgi:hypothetical protein
VLEVDSTALIIMKRRMAGSRWTRKTRIRIISRNSIKKEIG